MYICATGSQLSEYSSVGPSRLRGGATYEVKNLEDPKLSGSTRLRIWGLGGRAHVPPTQLQYYNLSLTISKVIGTRKSYDIIPVLAYQYV